MPILGLPPTKVPEECQGLLIIVPSTCLSDTSDPPSKWAPGGRRRAAAQLPHTQWPYVFSWCPEVPHATRVAGLTGGHAVPLAAVLGHR